VVSRPNGRVSPASGALWTTRRTRGGKGEQDHDRANNERHAKDSPRNVHRHPPDREISSG
jgi:hypothetical protein